MKNLKQEARCFMARNLSLGNLLTSSILEVPYATKILDVQRLSVFEIFPLWCNIFFNAIYSFIVFFRIFSLFVFFLTVTDLRSNLRISISPEALN